MSAYTDFNYNSGVGTELVVLKAGDGWVQLRIVEGDRLVSSLALPVRKARELSAQLARAVAVADPGTPG